MILNLLIDVALPLLNSFGTPESFTKQLLILPAGWLAYAELNYVLVRAVPWHCSVQVYSFACPSL